MMFESMHTVVFGTGATSSSSITFSAATSAAASSTAASTSFAGAPGPEPPAYTGAAPPPCTSHCAKR